MTLGRQLTARPVPYACAQPYHTSSCSQCLGDMTVRMREEFKLHVLCFSFTRAVGRGGEGVGVIEKGDLFISILTTDIH